MQTVLRASAPRRASLRSPRKSRWAVPLLALAWTHCASPPPASEPQPPPQPKAYPEPPKPVARSLAPLAPLEQQLREELAAELAQLESLGDRPFDGWNLAAATDHVAARLSSFGYEVKRRGFRFGDAIAQNLEVEVPGLRRGNQVVVVGARLDTNPGSPGADDNASGVAATLVLAKRAQDRRALRSLRFVFLSSAAPRDQREGQGAWHYANFLEQDEREVVCVLELRGLGSYSEAPESQRFPAGVPSDSDIGEFIALLTPPEAGPAAEAARKAFESEASLPTSSWTLPRDDQFLNGSSSVEFIERGFPTLLVTDTAQLRNPDFGTNADTLATLDVDRMARVVAALQPALLALTGPYGQAPTPTSDGLMPDAAQPEPGDGAAADESEAAPATAPDASYE